MRSKSQQSSFTVPIKLSYEKDKGFPQLYNTIVIIKQDFTIQIAYYMYMKRNTVCFNYVFKTILHSLRKI